MTREITRCEWSTATDARRSFRIYHERLDALPDELTGEIVPEASIELIEVLDQWRVTAPVPDEA